MLVLARKANEGLAIRCPDGTMLQVVVTEVRGRYPHQVVRLGIQAPEGYVIHRDEVWHAIHKKEQAHAIQEPIE